MTTTTLSTTEAIAEMFTESTGRSILDSGDAYGRSWQRNQSGAEEAGSAEAYFMGRPEVAFSIYNGEFDYLTVDGFHWLRKNLDYDPELQAEFEEFAADSEDAWLVDMERFAEERDEFRVVNTYNYDNPLNETFQWVEWRDEYGDVKVLLSYHGGCDVRGGYTKPRAFTLNGDYMGDFRYEIYCTNWDRETTLDGEDVLVCGLSGQGYSAEIEWYDHNTQDTVDIDISTLKVHPEDETTLACPRCGSKMSGEIPTY